MPPRPLVPSAVFVSGGGTNLQAVIDAVRAEALALDLRLVVSNTADAYALQRARDAGIPTAVIEWDRARESRTAYAMRLVEAVRNSGATLVLLLGWMHVLAKEFLEAGFEGVLNLHPSYLPDDPTADSVTLPDGRVTRVYRRARAARRHRGSRGDDRSDVDRDHAARGSRVRLGEAHVRAAARRRRSDGARAFARGRARRRHDRHHEVVTTKGPIVPA